MRQSRSADWCAFLVLAAILAAGSAWAEADDAQEMNRVIRGAERSAPVTPYVYDGDVRDLPKARNWQPGDPIREIPMRHYFAPGYAPAPEPTNVDALARIQQEAPPAETLAADGFTTPTRTFAGQTFTGVNPPDTNGDVGPNHYIQTINTSGGTDVRIWDKAEPTPNQLADFRLDNLGNGSCANGLGDPVVLYDRLADRWLITEFSSSGNNLCLYVSQTEDPVSGGWYFYGFQMPTFPDYPKYAIWATDANGGAGSYIATANDDGPSATAFDRGAMLSGSAGSFQRLLMPELPGFQIQGPAPAQADGPLAPPSGAEAIVMRHRDTEVHGGPVAPGDVLEMWFFDVDWNNSANTTLTKGPDVDVSEFDSQVCGLAFVGCFPQPGSGTALMPIREVIMNRLQYINHDGFESLVGSFVVDADGDDQGGVRWFDLRRTGGGAWSLNQEGTYAIDGDNRWMSSIAMDQSENIALAYNVVSSSTFPSLRYTGRTVDDPPGLMTQAESVIHAGSASNSSFRYGDYAAMDVDPVDDCTFWFTGMDNTSGSWRTQVASFAFDLCGCLLPPSPLTVTAQVTGDNEVEIGWNDADLDTVVEYFVQRSRTPGGPYELIATIADTSPGVAGGADYFFSDTDVSGGIMYYYVVRASDGEVCKSAPSDEAVVTATGECTLPPIFGGVVGVAGPSFTTCTLEVYWNPATPECGGPVSYNVYRSQLPGFTPGAGNLLASGIGGTGFTDVNQLVDGTTYYYAARAVDDSNGSEEQNAGQASGIPTGQSGLCITGSGCPDNPFVDVIPDGPATVCEKSLTLTALTTGGSGGPYLFQWTRDGVEVPGAIGPTFTPDDLGAHSYNVKVKAPACPDNVFDGIPTELTFVNQPFFGGATSVLNPQTATCSLDVSWDAATTVCDGPIRYFVYRDTLSPVGTTSANLVAAGISGTGFTDPGPLDNRTTYHYVVQAQELSTGRTESNTVERSAFPDGPGSGPQAILDEDFENPADFSAWTVTTGPGAHTCGEWALSGLGSKRPTGGSGSFAIADNTGSDCNPLLGRTSTTITSPPVSVTLANLIGVSLEYDIWFNKDGNESAKIEVWDGSSWQAIWSGSGSINGHQSIDVTAYAAGNPAFQVRFDYQNATQDKWFSIDNVQVIALIDNACQTGSLGPISAPDGSLGTGQLRGDRLDLTGDNLDINWDAATCGGSDYSLIYGDLANVSSVAIDGSVCSIGASGNFTWSSVPSGSQFFLVVGTDGGGTESSWGVDSLGGERNGLSASGECGTVAKETSGSCP